MKKIVYPVVLFLIGSAVVISCSKSDSGSNSSTPPAGAQSLSVVFTDAPVSYDSVLIDIASVEAKIDTTIHKDDDKFGDNDRDDDNDGLKAGDKGHDHDNFGVWMNLNLPAGKYDFLKLRNGLDSLVAKADVKGTVRKIRIKLGNGSYIVKGGTKYPLQLINMKNNKNYVYINLHDEDRDGDDKSPTVKVSIDFDLGRSIIEKDGQFYLLPVLKPFSQRRSGKIEGKVLPRDAWAVVRAVSATMDTSSALPNKEDGEFKINGLKDGTYKVLYQSTNGYKDTTISNVMVSAGKETNLPTVTMH
ncbi:MAG: DUF4382 domain-containing protein, partial [Niabella sp.]|nr:DUF4382 domain-containing protein [Niabella sp.]